MEFPLPPDTARWAYRVTWPGRFWIVTAVVLLVLGFVKNINLLALLGNSGKSMRPTCTSIWWTPSGSCG